MNNKTRLIGVILSLGFMLFSFNHCVVKQKTASTVDSGTSSSTSNPTTQPTPTPPVAATPTPTPTMTPPVVPVPPPAVVQSTQVDVGVKNFEQIHASMAVLTGVSPQQNDVNRTFEELESQLPAGNEVKAFLAANQVAITKLAAEYCDVLVDDGNLRGNIWPGFNFGGTPNQVLSNNAQKFTVIDQTLNSFWGIQVGGSRNISQTEMISLVNDLLQGENLGNSTTTRNTMKGMCTAVLASARVTLM